MHGIREAIEEREDATLSPYAARAAASAGRARDEDPDPVRTCFQRDRDRVLHSKGFRRLKHKTQVFIAPVGDHYRTRLTHSLEVAQIARTIARALRLNEDLTEAIALAHDVGHTPFGHAGEAALDSAIREAARADGPQEFRHDVQSLRVVQVLEPLNLTREVLSGIGGHSKGERDLSQSDGVPTSTLEASVVRISDRVAYLNHDLDDALRAGIIREVPAPFLELGDSPSRRVGAMVLDLIEHSLDQPQVALSPRMLGLMNDLKGWLFQHVYHRYPEVLPEVKKAKAVVHGLYHHFLSPGSLPEGFEGAQGAVDYVAGMTDRFAIATYRKLVIPEGFDERVALVP